MPGRGVAGATLLRLLLLLFCPAAAESLVCTPSESFLHIDFLENTRTVRSNIGGQGGRCGTPGECEELQTASTPHELYLSNVAVDPVDSGRIDLRVVNTTEYQAYDATINGLKNRGSGSGKFVAINLLGPRPDGAYKHWLNEATFVELEYSLLKGGAPFAPARTFLTFFDFDSGGSGENEAVQFPPYAKDVITHASTELIQHAAWTDVITLDSYLKFVQIFNASGALDVWGTPIYQSSTRGIGRDNPADPLALTEQQKARAVMLQLEGRSSWRVRFAIEKCCTTGRNFLVAGYSDILLPICPPAAPASPPMLPAPSPPPPLPPPPPSPPPPSPPPPAPPPPSPPPPTPPPPTPPPERVALTKLQAP